VPPTFQAYRIHNEDGKIRGRLEKITLDALSAGEVVIEAAFSGVNYKDALAATGAGKIARRFPIVGGIDVAGYVYTSTDPRFNKGDEVVVVGCGLSEEHDGGYAEYVRVPADCVEQLPAGISLRDAMALGTAGFAAGIAIEQMEKNDQRPEHGPVLVTGATGGVGSFAIDMLAGLGYNVSAVTGKQAALDYLRSIGAQEVILRESLEMGQQPLEKARWAGAIDNVGGDLLAWLTRTVKPFGNIAVIGLAGGIELRTTVLPFILRGINLLGVQSVRVSPHFRHRIWERLAGDLYPTHLQAIISRQVALHELPTVFEGYLQGEVTGRTVVALQD
jgi:acrylyl-CoA reductase (NADPH)